MTYIIKISILCLLASTMTGCIMKGSTPENSRVVTMRVDTIYEGGVKDIAFMQNNGEMAYINRALEKGYTLEGFREKVLHKKVTLHLVNTMVGNSNHIGQMVVENDTIYSEF